MLTLRFQRQGKKKDFIFRVIAVDSKIAVNSKKSKEILGWWDPRINKFELKKERILYWISQGAQPSDSCYNLLVQAKIVEGKKRPITIRKKKEKPSVASASVKTTEDKKAMEGKEEKTVEETKDEVKPEEKLKTEETKEEVKKEETKPEEKEEKKKEKKPSAAKAMEDKEEEPKAEKVKEEAKEEHKEDKKDKVEKEEVPEEKTEK